MNERPPARDVIVIGGGVIGLSIAWELARHGVSVQVLEQGLFGQEASWAGAGILPPGNPDQANTVETRLRGGSHLLWPEWTEALRSQTGIDNGFHRCGGVEVCPPGSTDSLAEKIAAWRAEGVTAEPLNAAELHERLPALNPEITAGYLLPDLGQVRNPRHLKALHQACATAGVDLRAGIPVVDFVRRGERITAVQTAADEILPEYDFSRALPNKYASRYAAGSTVVVLEPDVAAAFPGPEAANQGLRALAGIIDRHRAYAPAPRRR